MTRPPAADAATGPSLSRRVLDLKPSATLGVTNRAKALKRQGVDVVSFAAGEPDFDTPEAIKRAAIEALRAGQTKYMPTLGDPETRGVIAEKLARENGIAGLTGEHVGICVGGKHALYVALHCLLDPASVTDVRDVLLPVPAWVSYAPMAELAGGRVVEIATGPAGGFKITPEQLRGAITPRSRVLVLNTPSNPCGTMYTPDELRALAAVVAEASRTVAPDLVILVDEIYEKIVYGRAPHFSIGSVPGVAERTVTVNGMSKAYAMTGWRIGYAAAPGEFGLRLMRAMDTLQGQMTSSLPAFCYPAVRAALTQCAGEVEAMRREFAARATLIHARMRALPGVSCVEPQGAFYVFPDVSGLFGRTTPAGSRLGSALHVAEALLNEAHVAAVPGEDFGGCGGRHVRFSFACSAAQINAGMDRVEAFVKSLR